MAQTRTTSHTATADDSNASTTILISNDTGKKTPAHGFAILPNERDLMHSSQVVLEQS